MFIRGCYHDTDCATTDNTAHYITNDYYCGSGIGGDSPGCADPTMTTLMPCTDTSATALGPDGKSGTPGGAVGLTSKTSGVFRKSIIHLSFHHSITKFLYISDK